MVPARTSVTAPKSVKLTKKVPEGALQDIGLRHRKIGETIFYVEKNLRDGRSFVR
jgi:hypothetical protein